MFVRIPTADDEAIIIKNPSCVAHLQSHSNPVRSPGFLLGLFAGLIVTSLVVIAEFSLRNPPIPPFPIDYTPANFDKATHEHLKPKIAIITLMVGDVPNYAYTTLQDKYVYAAKHGYLHHPVFLSPYNVTADRPAVWGKLPAAYNFLRAGYDWVWLLDSDTVITNHTVKIEDMIPRADWYSNIGKRNVPTTGVVVDEYGLALDRVSAIGNKDCNGFNFGSTLLRGDPWTLNLLSSAWEFKPTKSDFFHEQSAIANQQQKSSTHWLFLPQHTINAYPENCLAPNERAWTQGDFVVHFAGIYDDREKRVKEMMMKRVGVAEGAPEWRWLMAI